MNMAVRQVTLPKACETVNLAHAMNRELVEHTIIVRVLPKRSAV